MAAPKLKLVADEPPILEYNRHETAAEIAERIRKGIRRRPMVEMRP